MALASSNRTRSRAALLALFAATGLALCGAVRAAEEPTHSAALDDAIIAAAKRHGVPESLVRRIIMRESRYNPKARNHSFWGLMQISFPTAQSMGFKGTRDQLLNPVVNLRYAVPYLANAFVIAGKREDAAVRLYAAGYYQTARSRGLLPILRTANSTPLSGVPDDEPVLAANAVAQPPQSVGIFGALFGPGQTPPQPAPQIAAYSADTAAMPQGAVPALPPPSATPVPPGTFDGATVAMVTDKKGDLAPPKKWAHDGGMTLIARGEQGLDQIADRSKSDNSQADNSQSNDDTPRKSARHRLQKITTFAALDVPPASAQAYAGSQDPRFAATDSQAAIAQATQAPTDQPVASAPDAAAAPPSIVPTKAEDDKPAKRRVRVAKHHKPTGKQTQQALADKPVDTPTPGQATQ